VIWEPELAQVTVQSVMYPNGTRQNDPFLHRYAVASGGDKPHVVYPKVIERTLDFQDEATNGEIIHSYFTGNSNDYQNGIYANRSPGFQSSVNNYGLDFRLGKNKSIQTIKANGETQQISQQNFDYHQEFAQLQAVALRTNLSNSHKYVTVKYSASTNSWGVHLVDGEYKSVIGGENTDYMVAPDHSLYSSTPADIFFDDKLASLSLAKTYARARWGMLTDKIATVYENGNALSQRSDYFYYGETGGGSGRSSTRNYSNPIEPNDTNDDDTDTETVTSDVTGLLHYSLATDSSDDLLMTKYSYPGNLPATYNSLITANMLNVPVKTKTFEQDFLLGSQRTVFNGKYPQSIATEKGGVNNSSEERLTFVKYSAGIGKNLLEAKRPNDESISYIWSYDQRYLVAKVENATFSEVAQALGVSESTLENFPESSLAQLNTLRTGLPQSLVTTYTYIPQVGVKTITDPRGYVLTYEYDDYHRLRKIIDQDGKVVEKYEYNTKPFGPPQQTTDPPLVANVVDIVIDNTSAPNVSYTAQVGGLEGGTGSYTYQWYRKIDNAPWADVGTTTVNQYQFSYSVGDSNYCDGNQSTLLIRCLVTDSNGATVEPQSTPRALVCVNDNN